MITRFRIEAQAENESGSDLVQRELDELQDAILTHLAGTQPSCHWKLTDNFLGPETDDAGEFIVGRRVFMVT